MDSLIDKLYQAFYTIAFKILTIIWFFTRPKSHGTLVGIWHEGKVLIIKNSYRKQYALPGGNPKRNENALKTAIRELKEEVNLMVDRNELIYAGEFTAKQDFKDEIVTFFEINTEDPPPIVPDNREVVWAEYVPLSLALDLDLLPIVRTYLVEKQAGASSGKRFPGAPLS